MGIIDKTRYYIPSKNFWGAFTAVLSKKIMKGYNASIYEKIGEILKANTVFSYFYPMNGNQTLLPIYTEDGFKYREMQNGGTISQSEFERKFISSYTATAIDGTTGTAENESLHEVEFILHNTCFFGYLFLSENFSERFADFFDEEAKDKITIKDIDFSEEGLKSLLSDIWVGGERNYGYGQIKLHSLNPSKSSVIYNEFDAGLTENVLKIKPESKEFNVFAHTYFSKESLTLKRSLGAIEPLVGREWNTDGTGRTVTASNVCFIPGSKLSMNRIPNILIEDYGKWLISSKN